MSERLTCKVLVVGGGPGGYVAAIRAGQLGLDTIIVEADRLGGTCLIRGCIPSKAVIHAAGEFAGMTRAAAAPHMGISLGSAPSLDLASTVAWKDGIVDRLSGGVAGLLKRAKVRHVAGWAMFSDAKTCRVETADGPMTISAEHVILATGSVPAALPHLLFGGRVISSTEALDLPELPARLVVIGAGYIGLELGSAFARLGSKVTIVEAQSRILPSWDAKLTAPVKRWLDGAGVTLHLEAKAISADDAGLTIEASTGERLMLPADRILMTVGRVPLTSGWGLETMAVAMDGQFVRVDDRCATSMKNVWAIGDLVGEPMLAHKASAQGEMVAEIIAGARRRFAPQAIPAVCFTQPEIVSVGVGPDEIDAADTVTGVFPFAASGRALSVDAGEDGGFVRVIARKDGHRIIGIQAVGQHIAELSAAFTQAIEMGAVLEDVAGLIYAHPTLGEGFHEASLKALGHAIHI